MRAWLKHNAEQGPNAWIHVISNPVNSTVSIAVEILKKKGVYDPKNLFGITTLDVVRANTFFSQKKGLRLIEVDVPLVGGHAGITILPLLSKTKPSCESTQEEIEKLTDHIQNGGTEVVEAKARAGSTTLSMAYASARFVESSLRAFDGDSDVFECSYVQSQIIDLPFFASCVKLGKKGIEGFVPSDLEKLTPFEQEGLENLKPELKASIKKGIAFANKHGLRQLRTAWFDGPTYITQCPIMPGCCSFLYNFTVTSQRGTLWWNAHISWMRSTVYGAFIIHPKVHHSYPFPTPDKEIPLVLGEWWNSDSEAVIAQALQSGAGPNVSDAYTINGQPGALYNCSKRDMFKLKVAQNQTYLLRIINAALNDELFLTIANHTLTVVEIDATYTKPYKTDTILIAPGQTTNALLTTDQTTGKYVLAVRAYNSAGPTVPFDNSTGIAMVEYEGSSNLSKAIMPSLPAYNDTTLANNLSASLRSINSKQFPALVPLTVDRNLLFTVGLARKACPRGKQCQGPSGGMFAAAINNISFSLPSTSLLQSFFPSKLSHVTSSQNASKPVFPTSFPDEPTRPFNFTGNVQPNNTAPQVGTRLSRISFNTSVQLVLQGTSILGAESHPIHLHGYNFFVVGQGTGNFNSSSDPATFNLVDPPERNTIGVPRGGWVALRFRADNPGVWFLHCHLEIHTSWGLDTAFLVTNGKRKNQSLQPPPLDLPTCQ